MLVGGSLFLVSPLPALQIPNFKTSATTDERHLALQAELFAELFRQNEAALFVRYAVLSVGMKLPKKNAAITCGNGWFDGGVRTHPGEFLRRHDEEILMLRLGQDDEIFAFSTPPTGGNRDAIFFVNRMTKFSGVETLLMSIGIHGRVES